MMYIYLVLAVAIFPIYSFELAQKKCEIEEIDLHFDVNKTLIGVDTSAKKSLDKTILGILAEFTFEKWDGKKEQSYYAFVTDQIIQNQKLDPTDEKLKEQRSEMISKFPDHLKQYHPLLFEKYEQDKNKMLEILSTQKVTVFPSFIKAMLWITVYYPKKCAIYLRTFGEDAPTIIPTIESKTPIKFSGQGTFKSNILTVGSNTYDNLAEFFKNPERKHFALRDDYSHWKAEKFQSSGGKPFIVSEEPSSKITLFFDDNADDPDKPILQPRDSQGKLLGREELLKKGIMVAVNPKEAILDPDYYIKKISSVLSKKRAEA